MRRRTLLVVLSGLAAVVAAGVVVLWPRPPSRVTQENFGRIREGMSRAEVEAILGPAGDYRTGPSTYHPDLLPFWDYKSVKWEGNAGAISVGFDESGRTRQIQLVHSSPIEQGPIENLL
jgi:hypothetical protein